MAPHSRDETSGVALLSRAIAAATLLEENDRAYWAAVGQLRSIGPQECWVLVAPLAKDGRPQVRALVPDVLRYFEPHPLREDAVNLMAEMLLTETAPMVLAAIATAFVDLKHELAADLLPALLDHPIASVRSAAVHGLLTAGPRTVQHLVKASTDSDTDVRNWSTFGLRMLLGERGDADAVDTEEVRNALAERLSDEHDEIRAEAILALATRRDPRALAQLKHELRHWPEWDHCFEAAAHLRSPDLYPLLQALLKEYPEEERALGPAMEACRPISPELR